MRTHALVLLGLATAAVSVMACSDKPTRARSQPSGSSPGTAIVASAGAAGAAVSSGPGPVDSTGPATVAPLAQYEGSAIVRDPASRFLVVADEDHRALRVLKLPLGPASEVRTIDLPGRPAQLVALSDRILVTIREPAKLMALGSGSFVDAPGKQLLWEAPLPSDAWGLAVANDLATAFVSSAYGRRVSAVTLASGKVRWSVETAREPRGLLERQGRLFVNHLVGQELTELTKLNEPQPVVKRLLLPPAPIRARNRPTQSVGASLGYALAADPQGRRVFAARHALGVSGEWLWYGAMTIDVWLPAEARPALDATIPARVVDYADAYEKAGDKSKWVAPETVDRTLNAGRPGAVTGKEPTPLAATFGRQPRHLVYRGSTGTLLVASEGLNSLDEYVANASPALMLTGRYDLGAKMRADEGYPIEGGAPTAITLSADETVAYVYCRSTDDVVVQPLDPDPQKARLQKHRERQRSNTAKFVQFDASVGRGRVRLVAPHAHHDPADPRVATLQQGRATFFQAASANMGQDVACASCHPDGRDDAHVWFEVRPSEKGRSRFFASAVLAASWRRYQPSFSKLTPLPRQTPTLAARVGFTGPYGWRGDNATLDQRIVAGFTLHRSPGSSPQWLSEMHRDDAAAALAVYLRKNLWLPERLTSAPQRARVAAGKQLFMSDKVGCRTCHLPKQAFRDGQTHAGMVATQETNVTGDIARFLTPSLVGVGDSAPYFHDGSVKSLRQLLEQNNDRMGVTSHLDDEQKRSLVAYLESL